MAYDTEVNKGSINMSSLARHLNERNRQGWRLQHIFEQHGNTVLIYEKDEHITEIIGHLAAIRTGIQMLTQAATGQAIPTPQPAAPSPPANPTAPPPGAPPPPRMDPARRDQTPLRPADRQHPRPCG